MEKHRKKVIAPVIVAIILVIVNIRIATILIGAELPKIIVVMGTILPLFISVIVIMVLVERIREIQKGEEDDLGKY